MFKRSSNESRLHHVPGLEGCSAAELDKLEQSMDTSMVTSGRTLMVEGEPAREGFLIVIGTAVVTRAGEELATLKPGDIVGEMGLLDKEPRTATVTATSDMEVRAFSAPQFASLELQEPFRRLLTRRLSARLRAADERASTASSI